MGMHDKIIEEATKLFLSYGTRNVTMDEIAASLGISKRTVYENFKDKTELVNTCLKSLVQQHEAKNMEIINSSRNVIETIFTFMREGIKAMNAINPVFFLDMKKYYGKTWNEIQEENVKNAFKLTKKLLEKGIKESIFRENINIPIVAKLFNEQMNLLADEKVFPRDEYNYPEVFESLTINFMRGISTKKGIEIIDKRLE